ncbi:MAG: Mpo1-like protein [Terriglobales bacterium]
MGLYSHYDGAHNHPVNRALHMIAIPLGFSSVIVVWWHWVVALLLIPPLSRWRGSGTSSRAINLRF